MWRRGGTERRANRGRAEAQMLFSRRGSAAGAQNVSSISRTRAQFSDDRESLRAPRMIPQGSRERAELRVQVGAKLLFYPILMSGPFVLLSLARAPLQCPKLIEVLDKMTARQCLPPIRPNRTTRRGTTRSGRCERSGGPPVRRPLSP